MKKQLYWILIAGFLLAVGLVSQTAVSAQKPLLPNGVGITAVPIQIRLRKFL